MLQNALNNCISALHASEFWALGAHGAFEPSGPIWAHWAHLAMWAHHWAHLGPGPKYFPALYHGFGQVMDLDRRPRKKMAMICRSKNWKRISRKLAVLTCRDESRSGPEKNYDLYIAKIKVGLFVEEFF